MPRIVNVEQAAGWNGADGDYWTEHDEHHNAAIRPHGVRMLSAARITAGDQVLDIGCGCGESTRDAARLAGAGGALGVDLSARMLERARERSRAEGLTNVRFEQADAQVHPFDAHAFDDVISRFGAMFFADPVAAFRNIGRAVRRGGRLALLAWQELARNEWLVVVRTALAAGRDLPVPPVGAPGPFGLADPDMVRATLTQAGFEAVEFEDVQEPFRLGADTDDAFEFVRGIGVVRGLLEGLDADTTARALDELRATIATHDTGDGVVFDSRAWIITAHKS